MQYKATVEKANQTYTFDVDVSLLINLLADSAESVQAEAVKKICSVHHGRSSFPTDSVIGAATVLETLSRAAGKPSDEDIANAESNGDKLASGVLSLEKVNNYFVNELATPLTSHPSKATLAVLFMNRRKRIMAEAKAAKEATIE